MLKGFLLRYLYQLNMGKMVITFRVGVQHLEGLCRKVIDQSRLRATAIQENITHERNNLINQYYRKTNAPLKLDNMTARMKQAAELERQNQSEFLQKLIKMKLDAEKYQKYYKKYMKKAQNDAMLEFCIYKYCQITLQMQQALPKHEDEEILLHIEQEKYLWKIQDCTIL